MKISTLLEREPFKQIFETTLASFLEDKYGRIHFVGWELKEDSKQQQKWYCNPLINSIFIEGVDAKVFESINGEYAHNPMKPWRSRIQKLYLFLSQSKLTAIALSKYTINISPPVVFAENKLIIGGNTKLRVIDIVERKVYVLLKSGFDKEYIEKEIYIRREFPYLPVPKILESSKNKEWYSEEYISGKPPNRFDQTVCHSLLIKAVKVIHKVLIGTERSVTISDYAMTLEARIASDIDQMPYMNKEVARDIKIIASKLKTYLKNCGHQELKVAYCHGDFHQGNILSDGESFWILDWEYSGEKQIGYDLLILLLESRIEEGFAERFLNIADDQFNDFQRNLIDSWPKLEWDDEEAKRTYLFIFLLEELVFYIGESKNDLFYKKTDLLKNRRNEFKKIVDFLL